MTFDKDNIEFLPLPTHGLFRDITGRTFNRLTVLGFVGRTNTKARVHIWACRCECGNITCVTGADLTTNNTKSCGCWRNEVIGALRRTHGKTRKVSEYGIWCAMRERCNNPKNKGYKNYGGRGITVCERWLHSFENFFADMGARPSKKHVIDRIDNDGNYEPNNCKWATQLESVRNRRSTIRMTYQGVTKTLKEWCNEFNLNYKLAHEHFRKEWDVEKILHFTSHRSRST